MNEFGEDFVFSPGSTIESIKQAEDVVGIQFPEEYQKFLLNANGGEGFLGSTHFLKLWSIEEMIASFFGYGFSNQLPGFLPIGTDGGGEALAIRLKGNSVVFGFVPFADLVEENFISIAKNFDEAIRLIGEGKAFPPPSEMH